MKRFIKDERGVVTIEVALVLTLLVVPVALAVAKFAPPAIEWVQHTSVKLENNTAEQKKTQALLEQLIRQQGGTPSGSQSGEEANPAQGCDPTPGATERPC